MASRVASATVALPLVLLVAWAGLPWLTLLVAVATAVAVMEVCVMARRWGSRPIIPAALALGVLLVAAGHVLANHTEGRAILAPITAAAAGLSLALLVWRPPRGTGPPAVLVTSATALYIGGLLFHAPLLREMEGGRDLVVLLLTATFATDTSAFLVGRRLGRTPLAPSISPAKTVEGALGGILGTIGTSVAVVYGLGIDWSLGRTIAMGAVLGVSGQIGDLAESRLKRRARVEDSGAMVPGHGGVLDRLDSIVFNLVVVYYSVA